jgi:hypothetical protein
VMRFTSPREACEHCRFRMSEKPAYGDPKGRNGRLFVPTTVGQDPRVARRPVARRAHALVRRSAEPAKEESGACSNEARRLVTGNTSDPNWG